MRFFDNSRLSDYKTCNRYYYFRHVKDWTSETTNLALIFGEAWHTAMDAVWTYASEQGQTMTNQDAAQVGLAAFLKVWDQYQLPTDDPEWKKEASPRIPEVAMEMLYGYVEERKNILTSPDFRLIRVEQPFAIPIDQNDHETFYCGKIDKIIEWKGDLIIIDHKTTTDYRTGGRGNPAKVNAAYLQGYNPNSQMSGYFYAGKLLYGERFKAVWVDVALVHKQDQDFHIIPIMRGPAEIDQWLWEARQWIYSIKRDEQWLGPAQVMADGPGIHYMPAFARNDHSCRRFNIPCPYLETCRMYPNPIRLTDPPVGMKKEHWSPFDEAGLGNLGFDHSSVD